MPDRIQASKVRGRGKESVLHCWSKTPWRLYLTWLLFSLVCREGRVPFTVHRAPFTVYGLTGPRVAIGLDTVAIGQVSVWTPARVQNKGVKCCVPVGVTEVSGCLHKVLRADQERVDASQLES